MYKKRFDNRDWNQMRDMEAKTGVIPNADGSAYFRMGNTVAYASVYGPKEMIPRFLQNPQKGTLRVHYWMMPFSGVGGRVRPNPNRREQEISMVMVKSFNHVLKLEDFPNAAIDVEVNLPQTDAGSRCVAINAASLALADAGVPMKDLITAVAFGRVDDKLVVDLNYSEEAYEDGPVTDMPIAIVPRTKEIVLLQADGEITADMVTELLKLVNPTMQKIYEIEKKALLERYKKSEEM